MMAALSRGAALLCVLAGCSVYLNTLDCGLCFDDSAAIEKNEDLRPNGSWNNLLTNDFWGVPISDKDSHKSYRPLCVATFKLNYLVHGLAPMGYHLVNVLLHGVVCYLYVQLCGVIFSEVWPALIAGLLFAVHPIHTEAVAGVVGRADVLAGVFYISAILVYINAVLLKEMKYSGLFASLSLCLCSALSKEIGITAVALCLGYEYFIHRKMTLSSTPSLLHGLRKGNPPSWCWPFLTRATIMTLWTLTFLSLRIWLNKGPPIFSVHNNPAMSFPTPYRQLHWAYLVFYNLHLLFFPANLSAEYAMSTIPPISTLTDYRNALTLATFTIIAILTWAGLNGATKNAWRRPLVFGVAMMVFPFLPASNLFFPVGFVVAERVLYLPSMGFCMLVAMGGWQLIRRNPTIIKMGVFYLLVVHSGKTLVRNRDWFSSQTLFQSAIVQFPNNAKMYNNLAVQYDEANNKSLAVHFFTQSMKVEPHFITAYSNLAYLLRNQSDMQGALKLYQEASDLVARGLSGEDIHVAPKNVRVFNSLSNMLREHADDGPGALKYALKAIEVEPEWENGYHSKANALVMLGRLSEARKAFEKATSINPMFAKAHSNHGECLQKLGLLSEAGEKYLNSLQLEPNDILTKFRLAGLIIKKPSPPQEELEKARQLLLEVLEVEPDNGNATFSLGIVYTDLGRKEEGEVWYKKALAITPNHGGSLYNLGVGLTEGGRHVEALYYLERLVVNQPGHVRGWSQVGTCHMLNNSTQQASEAFEKALLLDPEETATLQNYGLLHIQKKQYKEALVLFNKLALLKPDNIPIMNQIKQLERVVVQK